MQLVASYTPAQLFLHHHLPSVITQWSHRQPHGFFQSEMAPFSEVAWKLLIKLIDRTEYRGRGTKTVISATAFPQTLISTTFPAPEESFAFTTTAPFLPQQDAIDTLVGAAHDTAAQGSLNAIIPDRMVLCGWADVFILLCQSGRMVWKEWGTALYGIAECVEMYEYVGNNFPVGQTRIERAFWGKDIGDDVEEEDSMIELGRHR